MTSTELVPCPVIDDVLEERPDLPGMVARAKEALDRAVSVEDVKAVLDTAEVAEAYYKRIAGRVWWATDAYRETAKVRLVAQRKVGEIRSTLRCERGQTKVPSFDWQAARMMVDSGLTVTEVSTQLGVSRRAVRHAQEKGWVRPVRDGSQSKQRFDKDIGISTETGAKWERLTRLSIEDIERFADEACEDDESLSASSILRLALIDPVRNPGIQTILRNKSYLRKQQRRAERSALLSHKRIQEASKRNDAIGRSFTVLVTKVLPDLQAAYDSLPSQAAMKKEIGQCMASAYAFEDCLKTAMAIRVDA